MKPKNHLLKYRLVEIETGKTAKKSVWLTLKEAGMFNYAYALNRVGLRYEKV